MCLFVLYVVSCLFFPPNPVRCSIQAVIFLLFFYKFGASSPAKAVGGGGGGSAAVPESLPPTSTSKVGRMPVRGSLDRARGNSPSRKFKVDRVGEAKYCMVLTTPRMSYAHSAIVSKPFL